MVRPLEEDESKCLNAEPDHDGGQDEGLGNGVGERSNQGILVSGDDGRSPPGEPADREDEQVGGMGQQGQPEDEAHDGAAHDEIQAAGVEQANREGEQKCHGSLSASSKTIVRVTPSTTR